MGLSLKKRTQVTSFLDIKRQNAQGVFLKRLGTLLKEGFSLKEALSFLKTISDEERTHLIDSILHELEKGSSFHEELSKHHFPEKTCAQIYFSLMHGNFHGTVWMAGIQLIEQAQKKKKFLQIINYPILLLGFMISMLFAMRLILLPHIEQIAGNHIENMGWIERGILLIVHTSPYWIGGFVLLNIVILISIRLHLKERTAIEKITFYTKIPFLKKYLQLYWTQFFSLEWSQLLKSGCSMKEITSIMGKDGISPFLQETGNWIEKEMSKGKSFQEALFPFRFLKSEVSEIITHGETSGNLGAELALFSSECEEEFNLRIEQMMERIQPIIFIFVALMIIAIYAALLLPTFNMLEGF